MSYHNITDCSYHFCQVVPAEGLVSILKKRNDTVGDHPAQMQQKPSKRRVRFQEIDDSLDQGRVLSTASGTDLISVCQKNELMYNKTFGNRICKEYVDVVALYKETRRSELSSVLK